MKHPGTSHWFRKSAVAARSLKPEVLSWLIDQGSLTRRLQQRCGRHFSVRVLGQRWQNPTIDEARLLRLPPRQVVLLRQVQLLCDQRVLVYARSVIPLASLRGRHRRLKLLGDKPLGAYLFADPSLRRERIELASIGPGDALFGVALSAGDPNCDRIWGRRSLFTLAGNSLLVSEYFLPELFER